MGAGLPGIMAWNQHQKSSLSSTGHLNVVPHEIELSDYQRLLSTGSESPSAFLNDEGLETDKIADLDIFFERVYDYYCQKGLWCIIVKWITELLSLGFTICISGFFLLFVDWHGLRNAKCGMIVVASGTKPCDLAKEALHGHPLSPFTFTKGIIVGYLAIFTIYWLFCFLRFFVQLKDTLKMRRFYINCLNVTDNEVKTTPWPVILEKVVQVQQQHQLCIIKDLSAHEVVMRLMRKENYLIGMVNKGVLAIPISLWFPGAGPAAKPGANGRKNLIILTKTLEWTFNWCILQSMFDRNYYIRREFISNPSSLRKRLMTVGFGMLMLSPFLIIFMLVYLFLRDAEQFCNHPSTAASRRWSNSSRWIFREFNEVDHLFKHRIDNSMVHASDYLKHFPSPIISLFAKLICFIFGGLTAILFIIAFVEESLLEGHIFGRNLFWYAAVFGAVTAISRSVVTDDKQILDPEGALSSVVQRTHYMPKRWRGKEHTDSVRLEFETLHQYTVMMLLEEMASIFLTPYLLIFILPKHVDDILRFLSDYTVDIEGVGHVCSFSAFDFESHGNSKYGSPCNSLPDRRSSQGKMEKSFLSFQKAYPSWEPNEKGHQFLSTLHAFEEQLTLKEAQQACALSQPRKLSPSLRGGQTDVIHRFPSRDVPYLGSLWTSSPHQRTYAYLLDWYYVAHPIHAADNPKNGSTLPAETRVKATGEFRPLHLQQTEKEPEENWGFQLSDRLQSHFGTSTSNPFFRESVLQQHDIGQPVEPTESRWWDRGNRHLPGPGTSFLEPPIFGYRNTDDHGDNLLGGSIQDQGGSDGMIDSRKTKTLLQTFYLDPETDEAFSLPFDDIYRAPLKSLSATTDHIVDIPHKVL